MNDKLKSENHVAVVPPGRSTKRLLNLCDTFYSMFVVTPLVVSHWYGAWMLMDHYAEYFPPHATFLFAILWHLLLIVTRGSVYDRMISPTEKKSTQFTRMCKYIFVKLYLYAFSVGCIMTWRSGFTLLQLYFGVEFWSALANFVFGATFLACFKSLRNATAPPFVIVKDSKELAFIVPTRFKSDPSKEPGFYFIDCAFSVLVIGSLVVVVWRGLWIICDLVIYPDQLTTSAWGSVAIGYGLVAVTFSMQSLMKWTCDRLNGWKRLVVADLFLTFSFVGTVNVWRGIWQLLDIHFLPDDRILGDFISHTVSFLLLALLNCSNSVLVRGVFIDAEEPNGQCVIFPIYYIRLIFEKERSRKQQKQQTHLESAIEKGENSVFLQEKSSNNMAAIVKSSPKSIEMTAMLNNKNSNGGGGGGNNKDNYIINKDHIITE